MGNEALKARLTAALESARAKENVLEFGAGPPRYASQDFHGLPPAEAEKRCCDRPSSHCASDALDRGQTFRCLQIKPVIMKQDEWVVWPQNFNFADVGFRAEKNV